MTRRIRQVHWRQILILKYRVWLDMRTIILLPNYNLRRTPRWSHVKEATNPNLSLSSFSNIWLLTPFCANDNLPDA